MTVSKVLMRKITNKKRSFRLNLPTYKGRRVKNEKHRKKQICIVIIVRNVQVQKIDFLVCYSKIN